MLVSLYESVSVLQTPDLKSKLLCNFHAGCIYLFSMIVKKNDDYYCTKI